MKGTSVGTISDADGKYDLTIPDPNGTLVFTFIGYKTQEVSSAGRQVVDVALILEELALEEVVVVGYGTKTKSTVTGSISTVSSAELMNTSAPTVAAALQGRVSGCMLPRQADNREQERMSICVARSQSAEANLFIR